MTDLDKNLVKEKYLLYDELLKVYESIVAKIIDLELFQEIIKELKEGRGLINLGGAYAYGSIENAENFIVPVGADYFVEMPKEKVLEVISKQVEELKREREKVKEEIEKIKGELAELLGKINKLE